MTQRALFEVEQPPEPACWRCIHGRRVWGCTLPGVAVCEHAGGPPSGIERVNPQPRDDPAPYLVNQAHKAARECRHYVFDAAHPYGRDWQPPRGAGGGNHERTD